MIKTALLVIDVQKGLFQKSKPVYGANSLLANINALVDDFHGRSQPVFFIRHTNATWLAEGSAGWQLHEDLHMAPGDTILNKSVGNAFQEKTITAAIRDQGVGRVIVTGLVTHGCVKAACEGALAQGYEVLLASDAHSSYNADAAVLIQEWNEKLAEKGVMVAGTAQIIAGL